MLNDHTLKNTIDKTLTVFIRQTGIPATLLDLAGKPMLELKTGDMTVRIEPILATGGQLAANAMLPLVGRLPEPRKVIVVTREVTVELAERLRENNVQFMDEAGNAYINNPPIYIFIKGNRREKVAVAPATGRAFKQTGLKVLFAFLCNPGLQNEPYRTIAARTGVALGMVNWVMGELKKLGFLLEMGKGRGRRFKLVEQERLLDRWVTAYAEQLRPRLLHGRYRGPEGWWKDAALPAEIALWGGEVAAAKLTGYLKPQEITVYVDKAKPAAVLAAYRLKKDPEGDVELLYRFWQTETVAPHGEMVHPILIYADLLATGNQRNLESAKRIYEQHIVQLIRED